MYIAHFMMFKQEYNVMKNNYVIATGTAPPVRLVRFSPDRFHNRCHKIAFGCNKLVYMVVTCLLQSCNKVNTTLSYSCHKLVTTLLPPRN